MSKVLFTSYSQDDFKREIKDVFEEILGRKLENHSIEGCIDGVDFEFSDSSTSKRAFKPQIQKIKEKYLTRSEVAKLLKISLPTLHRYTKDCILKSY